MYMYTTRAILNIIDLLISTSIGTGGFSLFVFSGGYLFMDREGWNFIV